MKTKTESIRELIVRLTAPDPIPQNVGEGVVHLPTQTGLVFETNEETYDYFLDVLPPHYMSGHLFCFAQGFTPHTLFFRRVKRFFVRQLTQEETEEFCRLGNIPLPGWW